MRKILMLCIISAWALSWNVSNTFSWDFPLMINPVGMIFNLNNGDAEHSALNICKNNGTDIFVPEYKTSVSRNEKFVYVRGKSPIVWVWFFASPPDSPSLTIRATSSGGDSWNLADKAMYFNGSGFTVGDTDSTNFYAMSSSSTVPNSVGKYSKSWNWWVVKVNGVPRGPFFAGSTSHTYYIVQSTPQPPLSEPWTDVLDYSCSWASGQTTTTGVVSAITSSLYTSGFNYESSGGARQY
jgi:hypothetical protein